MRYATVCSGIGAPSVAWATLDWRPIFFSEIERFPCRLLAERFPQVPNHGDITKYKDWPDYAIDLLVGGTPCQSFSVSGKRQGLADRRGNLAMVYLAILGKYRPRWIIWENVLGVVSSNAGRDFSTFLSALAECGYHAAWRVLDARDYGLPQMRRRLFLVGYFGDWRPAAKVLFEPDNLQDTAALGEEAQEADAEAARGGSYSDFYRRLGRGYYKPDKVASTCMASANSADKSDIVLDCGRPRRLTPLEYERLMGYPDGWTDIAGASDTARYQAIGNSMAVNCVRWIGQRISEVEND
ncbi:MAG: DNA cytosine methyltransferase [Candidatus Tokpelaia sp.]|nr:MAG: DNA cytosine methyltransferase [Candidatus Tokpelaia sp.]